MNRDIRSSAKDAAQRQAIAKVLAGAIERIHADRLDEAAALLNANGGAALKNPVGCNILGDVHLKQGNPRQALRAFDAALKLAPSFPEAHSNRGVALQELGRYEEALAAEERALRHRPDYPTAHYNRGNLLRQLGRLEEAVAAYDRALMQKHAFAEARLNRGIALVEANRLVEALGDFRQVLAERPGLFGAHIGQARAHLKLGQTRDALAAVAAALTIEPDNPEAWMLKGRVLVSADEPEEALEAVERALAGRPDLAAAHAMRANVLGKLGRFAEALAAADEAIRLAPKDAGGHAARALALGELGRIDEQLETLRTAERLGAADATFHHARALALGERGAFSEAIASFERAIALEPEGARIHHNFALLLLSRGDFQRGWAEHEWRLKNRDYKKVATEPLAPPWRGQDLAGKKILILREQGHGDNIQFARFLPAVAGLGAEVSATVARSLWSMFQRAFPAIDVADGVGMRSGFDYQIAMMSLPHVLNADLVTLPNRVPYLFADQARVDKWRDRLGPHGFKVGIAWQGNPEYVRDRQRSIPLKKFEPLAAVPGVRLISIQAINGLDQLAELPPGMSVESLGAEISNNPEGFDEIAAVMANLDLVISSDTVTAHLGGALGRPVWVALNHYPDWRWLDGRTDSPWYPSIRLFRQQREGDWEGVFAAIAGALGGQVAGAG
ncbi:MAG: tetratricopeptide repeat protein [Bauldia sp.]